MIRHVLLNWALLTISVSFLIAVYNTALAESANVEGRVRCYDVLAPHRYGDRIYQTKEGRSYWCPFSIWIDGEIDSSTVNKVKELLDGRRVSIGDEQEYGRSGLSSPIDAARASELLRIFGKTSELGSIPTVGGELIIDSPGGSIFAAMTIGRMLRKERVTVLVTVRCVSACIMVLAGAVHRGYFGKVGIHRPFFDLPSGSQSLTPDTVKGRYQQMLQEIRAYLREMNVPERLADDMLAIDPADVRYLSHNQLYDYGLRDVDPIEKETIDLQKAQALGLDRREYMRRETLRKAKCFDASLKTLEAVGACNNRVMKFGR
jgi:ATP-dependent protease ClpP protease subunit